MHRGWLTLLALVSAVGFVLADTGTSLRAQHGDAAGKDAAKADAAKGEAHTAPAGHEAEHEPNIFEYALDLTIWTLVVFLVLLFVLWKFAWGPMLAGLQKREETIHSAVEEARKAREEAQQLRGQLQAEMDRAAEKVRGMIDDARRDAQRVSEELTAKARTEIQTERERLHREIELARDQALQELWTHTARLATLVSSKAIRRQLNEDDHRRLVDEAIADLGAAGNERQREVAGVST